MKGKELFQFFLLLAAGALIFRFLMSPSAFWLARALHYGAEAGVGYIHSE